MVVEEPKKKVATYTGSSDAQVIGSTRTTYTDDQTNYEQINLFL